MRAPARPAATGNGSLPKPARTFGRSRGITRSAHKVLLYGTGGIGKTSCAADFPGIVFADIERSSDDLDIERVDGISNWADLRAWLQSEDAASCKAICIDSATKAEEWCVAHVIANVPHEKGNRVTTIEGYGFGKGYMHVYEEWRRFLGDLDNLFRKGVNVVLIAHEQVSLIPNPAGEDFKRYQPRLQSSEKSNSLAATKEWSDHVLFVSYDVVVKEGKARGGGSRTIYSCETATHMAKTRTLTGEPFVFNRGDGASFWSLLLAGKVAAVVEDGPPAE